MRKKTSIKRSVEVQLLIMMSLIYIGGIMLTHYSRSATIDSSLIYVPLPLLLSIWTTHFLLRLSKSHADELLLPLLGFLCATGHIEIFRIDTAIAFKQSMYLIAGFLLFNIWYFIGFDYRNWEDYKYTVFVAGIIIQIAVMILGVEINGVKLWFTIGSVSFQPVEIVKILLVIFLASYLKQKKEFITSYPKRWMGILSFKYLVPLIVIWSFCEITLVVQKDLGMALLLFGTFMCLFYIATERLEMILCGFLLFFISSWALAHKFAHVQVRITSWLDPLKDPGGSGYQLLQALFAFSQGGLWGTGLGMGFPNLIPAVHTDYIFAVIGEELGFLGGFAVIIIYFLLVERIFTVSIKAFDEFGMLLSSGLGSLIACQILIIIGGTTKLIPMTGITLPFISYGGSSIIANFFLLSLIFQISNVSGEKRDFYKIESKN